MEVQFRLEMIIVNIGPKSLSSVPGIMGDAVGYTIRFETARKTHRDGPTVTNNEHLLNQNKHLPKKAPAQAHITKIKPKTEAAQSRKLPQFGAWEGTDEIAYTMVFNNIQKKNKDEFISLAEPYSTPMEVCSKVPQFGAWEGAETVAYTAYFYNARKNKNVESRQSPLHPRREKLQYEPSTSKNSPNSKIVTSSAWGAGENFKAYCNAIERRWPPSNQSTPRRGNRPRFEPQRHKD
ncbi:uncharacterized protein LOC130813066 [Amaranthus tricolor]|uniref:uncharacterized protein LOC130813066 n=1 Tax=Amaranthus tricolor TaxID=29722 RepID=UPI00258499D1|nr:uncharacterized protein LOC130813066 [Amaranthus tricolor]